MKTSIFFTVLLAITTASPIERRAASVGTYKTDGTIVTAQQYADLVRYAIFSSAAYSTTCASPNGATLVSEFNIASTDTQGYVARDDKTKEIILALRGSSSPEDFLVDVGTTLVPCASSGVPYPSNALCHIGFQSAYNSAVGSIIPLVSSQLAKYPKYTITVAGHSLGAGLASIASLSMKYNFKNNSVVMYNYGQPRTGDVTYANFHDAAFPLVGGKPTSLRSTHELDGVPQAIREGSNGNILATTLGTIVIQNNPKATTGYRHHSTEFWQLDSTARNSTIQCVGQEDYTCQDGQFIFAPLLGIDADHLTYYGIPMGTGNYCG